MLMAYMPCCQSVLEHGCLTNFLPMPVAEDQMAVTLYQEQQSLAPVSSVPTCRGTLSQ